MHWLKDITSWVFLVLAIASRRHFSANRRHKNQGAKTLIDDIQQAQLWQALQSNAPDGGLWNGPKVADWLSEVTGKNIRRYRGWEILRQMTFRLRVPRPSHTESDYFEQKAWKKTSHTG